MQILKRGEVPEKIPWWIGKIVICQNCKSEIKLEELDILNRVTEKDDNCVEFCCPLLGCENIIKEYKDADKSPLGS